MSKKIVVGESVGSNEIAIVNPGDRDRASRFILCFGAYGWTKLMVWADHLEDALDEAVDWIAEHAPGLLADDQVNEEYNRLVAEGVSEEDAQEAASMDTTCAGNSGHYLLSWEWGIVVENPTRAQVLELMGRTS